MSLLRWDRSRPPNPSSNNSSRSKTLDARRSALPIVSFRSLLGASFLSPTVGFALHILGKQVLMEADENLKAKCDESSSLNNEWKRLLQDSQAKVSFVRVNKCALAERTKTLKNEKKGLRAGVIRLWNLFQYVSATSQDKKWWKRDDMLSTRSIKFVGIASNVPALVPKCYFRETSKLFLLDAYNERWASRAKTIQQHGITIYPGPMEESFSATAIVSTGEFSHLRPNRYWSHYKNIFSSR